MKLYIAAVLAFVCVFATTEGKQDTVARRPRQIEEAILRCPI